MAHETQRLFTALFLTGVAVLQVADLVTTVVALQAGAREGNPFMVWLIAEAGTLGLFVVKAALAGLFIGLAMTVDRWQSDTPMAQAGAVVSLLVMLLVVASNSAALAILD